MKLRHLLFGLLAGVAFVACTNDNEPAGASPVNGGNEVAATKYMAINFVMPGDATTRAWTNDFEAATGNEIAVADAMILFFDGEGQVADPFTTGFTDGWTNGEGSVDKKHAAVIVLKNAIKDPTSIVAVLNSTANQLGITRATTMTQLKNMTANFRKDTPENFAMINSVYVNGTEVQFATPATGKVKESEDAALADPVKIAVEKVVAKVTLTNGTDTATEVTTKPKEGEQTGKAITVDVDGWWLDSTNPKSYLVKSLATSYDVLGQGEWWKDATNFRSYWATSLEMNEEGENKPEHFTLTAGKKALEDPIYAHENTDQAQPTELVVAATLKVDGNAETLVKFMTDVYTQTDFETALYGTISTQYYTRTGDGQQTPYEYTSVAKDKIKIDYKTNTPTAKVKFDNKDIEDYEAVVEMTYTGTEPLYEYAGAEKEFTPLTVKVQYWVGGKTYYHIPIIHNSDVTVGTGTTAHPLYGVVRNHLYKIKINSITGLGTAVANTDNVIIPVTPPEDKKTYLAADIVILKYKVVEQNVDLK
ncbi:MAG: Mfa1 fimbrilin C-terminal domain-containing protein [Aeriscardovia sp.]|nr:Mfa1 fimbrilin C-terminal domain-containing protein [Aeriscardovia sp.]